MEADKEAEAQLSDYNMAGISDNEELDSETEYDPDLPLDQETLDQEIDSVELLNHHPI
ncbi:hypothetical protein AAEP93_003439, partial [Penicillium crustosum]